MKMILKKKDDFWEIYLDVFKENEDDFKKNIDDIY